MTAPATELTTADGRDQAIRDRAAAFMAAAGWDTTETDEREQER